MGKTIKLLFVILGGCLYANNLIINDLNITYENGGKIDYLYIVQGGQKQIIRQQNLWHDAEVELNLSSANEEFIELDLAYKGNKLLGYIYTLKKSDNNFIVENVKLYEARGKICETVLTRDKKYINVIETNSCKDK